MGYRRIPTIHTIDDVEGEDGLIVRMKSISFGRVRRLVTLMDDDTKDEAVMDEISSQFAASLVSWNLESESGRPVPATAKGVDDQDFEFVMKLVGAWLDRITWVSDELGKGSNSGEKFPGQPVTMEAL